MTVKITNIRWLMGRLIFFAICLSTCKQEDHRGAFKLYEVQDSIAAREIVLSAITALKNSMALIQTGDLITRTGNDFTSQSLRKLNQRNTTYSHIGIAAWEADSLVVYHALGGEWNPNEELQREAFLSFGNPQFNNRLGIFRLAGTKGLQDSIHAVANVFYKQKLTFDMDFDLHSNNKMYCAEFVAKTFQIAAGGKLIFATSNIKSFVFFGVDDVFLHPQSRVVKEIIYR